MLDGRNRLLACEKAGVEPTFSEYDGDDASALALVISLNVQRRDLTAAQRAIVAARAIPMYEEEAKQRQGRRDIRDGQSLKSATAAARVFKVSDKSVQQAKAVLAEAPDLAAQVEACTLSLAAAYSSAPDLNPVRSRMDERPHQLVQELLQLLRRHCRQLLFPALAPGRELRVPGVTGESVIQPQQPAAALHQRQRRRRLGGRLLAAALLQLGQT